MVADEWEDKTGDRVQIAVAALIDTEFGLHCQSKRSRVFGRVTPV
jgi:hypothetical protein